MYGFLGYLWLASGIAVSFFWRTGTDGKVFFGVYFCGHFSPGAEVSG